VLLLVDFMNPLDFPGADKLAPKAVVAARAALNLKRRCREARIPAIYANDNFGRWESQFDDVVGACVKAGGASAQLAGLLAPVTGDLSILKPRHSAFYGTPLQFLLMELRARTVLLPGLTADNCVLFTAFDAFLRNYRVWVPSDCVAAASDRAKTRAREQMAAAAKVWTGSSRTSLANGLARAERMHQRDRATKSDAGVR
jgi:nicotinamidase-related amidase